MSHCCSQIISDNHACPECGQTGMHVQAITLRHTLKQGSRNKVDDSAPYYFCAAPQCNVVYFSENSEIFTLNALINRVSQKDPSAQTPLCYCYKITKGDVLEQIAINGQTDVINVIKQHMSQTPCFCQKSNPQGVCCIDHVETWLHQNRLISIAAE